jgi:predicted DsbA family dithiol-disulfide isomerase
MLLADLFRTSPEKIQAMVEGLKQTANQLGLPFGPRTKTYNSRLAQELGLWAESLDRGSEFHRAAFQAYFVDGLNLAQPDVLLALARQAGLSAQEAEQVLLDRSYAPAVDEDWNAARQLGVRAVPTFIMGERALVGARSYQELSDLAALAGAEAK